MSLVPTADDDDDGAGADDAGPIPVRRSLCI